MQCASSGFRRLTTPSLRRSSPLRRRWPRPSPPQTTSAAPPAVSLIYRGRHLDDSLDRDRFMLASTAGGGLQAMDLPEHSSPMSSAAKSLLAKHSAVSAEGRLRLVPIDGLILRQIRPVPHEDGHVTEVARASWPNSLLRLSRFMSPPPCQDASAPDSYIRRARTACSW